MYWKLRIPLLLGVIGVVSGLIQKFPKLFFVDISSLLSSLLFIGLIGIIFAILEITRINEKKVNLSVGVGIILVGIFFDFIMV